MARKAAGARKRAAGGTKGQNGTQHATNGHTNGHAKHAPAQNGAHAAVSSDEDRDLGQVAEAAVGAGAEAAKDAAKGAALSIGRAWSACERLAQQVMAVRVGLALVVLLVFADVLNAGLVYDDNVVLGHGAVTGKASILSLFTTDFWGLDLSHVESHRSWRPLTTLLLRVLHTAGNGMPAVFHAANLLGYAACVLMVHELARRWLADARAALVAALLFAVHPIHVEVVANITNLAEVASGILFLSSLLVYTSCVVPRRANDTGFGVGIALGGAAMFAKESGITVLGVLVVYEAVAHLPSVRRTAIAKYNELQGIETQPVAAAAARSSNDDDEDNAKAAAEAAARNAEVAKAAKLVAYDARVMKRVTRRVAIIAATIVGLLLLRAVFLRGSPPAFPRHMNHVSHDASLWGRFLTLVYLPAAHAWNLLYPTALCHDWSFDSIPIVRSPFDTRFLSALVVYYGLYRLVQLIVGMVLPAPAAPAASTRGSQQAKAESSDLFAGLLMPLTMGTAILVLPYLPASNLFFYVGFILADRVLFLPSVGYCLLAGCVLVVLNRVTGVEHRDRARRERSEFARAAVAVALVVVMLSFAVYSVQRTHDWSSDMTLTESALKANPGSAKLWYNRGIMRMEAGDTDGGLADLQKATLLWKDYSDALMALSTHYYTSGDHDKAFKYAQAITATELPVGDLGKVMMYGAAFTRLAEINAKRGLPAEPFFAKAFEIFSKDHATLRKIGFAYADQNDRRSIQYLKAVFQADPTDFTTANMLTKLYVDIDLHEAERWAYKALQAGSDVAAYNIGRLQQMMHDAEVSGTAKPDARAVKAEDIELWFRRSLEENPAERKAHMWLAHHLQFHAVPRNLSGAVHHYRQYLARNSNEYRANVNMGAILLDQGTDLGEAERCFRRALAGEPASIAAMANLGRVMHKRGRSQEAADYLYAQLETVDAALLARVPSGEQGVVSAGTLHDALAVIWASVNNRGRVEYHCGLGSCDTDATLKQHAPSTAAGEA